MIRRVAAFDESEQSRYQMLVDRRDKNNHTFLKNQDKELTTGFSLWNTFIDVWHLV